MVEAVRGICVSHVLISGPFTMAKKLCELKKLLKKDLAEYIINVNQPKFVCTKCGRVANEKKLVCSPAKMSSV